MNLCWRISRLYVRDISICKYIKIMLFIQFFNNAGPDYFFTKNGVLLNFV